MCCVDVRPFSMAASMGFQYFVGGLSPSYMQQTIHKATMERILEALAADVRVNLIAKLKDHIFSCQQLGRGGPYFGVQSDLTSTHGTEFCTLTVSFVPKGSTELERLTLTTKAFPGTHTASDVEPWVRGVTTDFFAPIVEGNADPSKIYVAATVDQGGNMVNAFGALGVPVLICTGHRLNSGINWALGINGTFVKATQTGTCKNPVLRHLVAVMTALAGGFSHSPCNNDAFKNAQEDM
ncbi:unnamed protein product [Pylaiella littoralis]